jgi:hypothetical protein
LTVRYEDFLCNEELTLRRICSFIGLEFLPEMLRVAASNEAQRLSQMSDLWASNCFSPIPANKDKFKSQLSIDEIEAIESLAKDHMLHYGYELMTAAGSPPPDDVALQACAERSALGRELAWTGLARDNYRDHALRRFRANYLARVRDTLRSEQMT